MEALDIARWQFGITTVYHFIFVPLTIGLAPLVAIMQTAWVVTKKDHWLRLTKFFGKLFLINFALGVVTGIVQEFQFGMNWSEYSRFVGDIFGAPLAMEGLAAFFIESTFLGLWIFGWDKLRKGVHLTMIWLVAFGVNLSAVFIIAANSWMQHPVGAEMVDNPTGNGMRAQLNDIGAVLTNSAFLAAFPHTITGAWLVAGTFVTGIAGWLMVRTIRTKSAADKAAGQEFAREVYRPGVILGLIVIVIGGLGVAFTGDLQAKTMFKEQPMKMAAAEALCTNPESGGSPFSVLAIGSFSDGSCDNVNQIIEIPGLTSFLAGTGSQPLATVTELDGQVAPSGSSVIWDPVQGVFRPFESGDAYTELYGEGTDYSPNLAVSYWTFRLMIGFAVFSAALALVGLWVTRRGRVTDSKLFKVLCLVAIPAPFLANLFGWIFTEMGRQPWIVVPNPSNAQVADLNELRMLTADGVSGVSPGTVLTSLIVFTLLYGVLAVFWFMLMRRYARIGVPEAVDVSPKPGEKSDADKPMSFAY